MTPDALVRVGTAGSLACAVASLGFVLAPGVPPTMALAAFSFAVPSAVLAAAGRNRAADTAETCWVAGSTGIFVPACAMALARTPDWSTSSPPFLSALALLVLCAASGACLRRAATRLRPGTRATPPRT